MSIAAIIVMIASILALWGVAGLSLAYSMRREERKLALIQHQGGFEPFCPAAHRDLSQWLATHPDSPDAGEMQALRDEQEQALRHYPQRFYPGGEAVGDTGRGR